MEAVKNIVDTNQIATQNGTETPGQWLTSLSSCTNSNGANSPICTIDTVNTTNNLPNITPCSPTCQALYLGSSGYTQATGQATPFTRSFYIQTFDVNGGSNNAANVIVTVTWPGDVVGGGGVTLEDTMYDTPLH
jgi:hypothetical protein